MNQVGQNTQCVHRLKIDSKIQRFHLPPFFHRYFLHLLMCKQEAHLLGCVPVFLTANRWSFVSFSFWIETESPQPLLPRSIRTSSQKRTRSFAKCYEEENILRNLLMSVRTQNAPC
ncbi:hypothetical protein CEXT_166371 [Caerostris extrusa]|uniref:Uncharacterized protein n=1 Tax=Caerostris extrusa TaxID=172846 RepID=A0AAV4UI43_CAEEX|nr:hypothetical protein CEXT_166371 [Caerostris extrusa]